MPLRCACTIFGRAFAPSTGVHAWDVENRLIKVEDATGSLIPFEYDGCEARTKRHAGGATMACCNKYWELDLTTGAVTRSYYIRRRAGGPTERHNPDLRPPRPPGGDHQHGQGIHRPAPGLRHGPLLRRRAVWSLP